MTNNITNQNNSASLMEAATNAEKFFSPVVDVYDNKESLVIIMDLPGVVKGDAKIEIDENNVLSVRAKANFHEPEGAVISEFESGNYYRAFSLNDEYNRDAISARFDNAVLEISIPRKEEVRPKKIEISM
jgi:HSP20 family protein